MGNGELRMDNGDWRMGNRELEMENQEFEKGKLKMENQGQNIRCSQGTLMTALGLEFHS